MQCNAMQCNAQVTEHEVQNSVRSIPKLDTLILVKVIQQMTNKPVEPIYIYEVTFSVYNFWKVGRYERIFGNDVDAILSNRLNF